MLTPNTIHFFFLSPFFQLQKIFHLKSAAIKIHSRKGVELVGLQSDTTLGSFLRGRNKITYENRTGDVVKLCKRLKQPYVLERRYILSFSILPEGSSNTTISKIYYTQSCLFQLFITTTILKQTYLGISPTRFTGK